MRPDVVIHPQTTEQVAAVLRIADEQRIPVVPRGAATGLAGGAVPVEGSICLNLARMNRILEISIPDTLAVVEPGVVTHDLQTAVEKLGFFYPPDPASVYQCTIGGNVATNAGGPRCLKYGVTGDYVLGLEVVLAGGHVLRLAGGRSKMWPAMTSSGSSSARKARWASSPRSPCGSSPSPRRS